MRLLVWACSVLALLLGVRSDDIGGLYLDPNHYVPGTLVGTRYVSDVLGTVETDTIALIGSDDGTTFWTLSGKFTDKASGALTVNFQPKGGPADLKGTYAAGKITWQDGNIWARSSSLSEARDGCGATQGESMKCAASTVNP